MFFRDNWFRECFFIPTIGCGKHCTIVTTNQLNSARTVGLQRHACIQKALFPPLLTHTHQQIPKSKNVSVSLARASRKASRCDSGYTMGIHNQHTSFV